MTYKVSSGTLNLCSLTHFVFVVFFVMCCTFILSFVRLHVCRCVCVSVFGMLLGDTLLLDTLEDASSYRQEVT